MTSFAWGLSPSESRPQTSPSGCAVSDTAWRNTVSACSHNEDVDVDIVSRCNVEAGGLQIPQLLINEIMVLVARKLHNNSTILRAPKFTVHKTSVSPENPPNAWLITLTACFPCDGTPVTRCVKLKVILDAVHVERSRVISAADAGVVPAEQALMDGVLPFNALSAELIVKS